MKTPRGSTLADVQRTHILRVLAETNAIAVARGAPPFGWE